jgi:hypothetical protein
MRRNETLLNRLGEIESQFRELLRHEFKTVSDGKFSQYLWKSDSTWGRKWRDEHSQMLEKLEKEILQLREKLQLPVGESPVSFVEEFVEQRNGLKDRFHGGAKHLADEMLKRLCSE